MSRYSRGRALLLVILFLLGAGALGCTPIVWQQPTPAAPPGRSVTVVGRGMAAGQPDMALVTLGVQTRGATAGEAAQQNSAHMNSLLTRLRELGIADEDIQTAGFSVSAEPTPSDGRPPSDSPAPGGYLATHTVQVKVRDLPRLGAILDAAVAAGANQVSGVTLSIADPDALEAQARAQAMEDAQARAQALAQLANLRLGPIEAIQERAVTLPDAAPVSLAGGPDAQETPPISPGELQVSSEVQVSYSLQ